MLRKQASLDEQEYKSAKKEAAALATRLRQPVSPFQEFLTCENSVAIKTSSSKRIRTQDRAFWNFHGQSSYGGFSRVTPKRRFLARLRSADLGDAYLPAKTVGTYAPPAYVPVIGHQAIGENAHGHEIQALLQEGEKFLVVPLAFEERRTKIPPVQRVVNHPAHIHPSDSPHATILPLLPSKEQEKGT